MAKRPKVCIERVLPADQMRFQSTVRRGGGLRAIIPIGKLWMNGSTLRVRFIGGTAAKQAKAKEQALWWTQFANLKFDFNNAPDAEIRVTFDSDDGAWSYVGTDNRGIPLDQPTMNLGFLDGGTAAHEFGHAIGLAHEHQNPAGGIEWNEAKVLQDLAGPPNNWTPDMIRHNVLNKYRVDQIRGTKFDPESIMLYFFPGSWVKSGVGTEENDVLSSVDKAYIASAQAYPKTAPTVDDATELKINATKRTPAASSRKAPASRSTSKTETSHSDQPRRSAFDPPYHCFSVHGEAVFFARSSPFGTACPKADKQWHVQRGVTPQVEPPRLKTFDKWTAKSIDDRQTMLIELAKEVWKTSLIENV